MSRKPPTEMDRLILFVELADHYLKACDELPLETGVSISMSEEVPLALELRLMLLRKFVEQDRDGDGNVHLRRVASAFGECFVGSSPVYQENLTLYAAEVGRVLEGKTGMVANGVQDEKYGIFYDALYGRLMHADWGRNSANLGRAGFIMRAALTDIYLHLDGLVREAHFSITSALEQGQLRPRR
ncbi:hypothetical protein ABLI39_03960 [Pseudarthrobacter sp. B907]|uniref:hypothetical protein n=1 Tax=Pseudarthrobacter sp. B907 TaxID=3158261 RepID=UPI0032DAF76D